jgi:hypothetical protein
VDAHRQSELLGQPGAQRELAPLGQRIGPPQPIPTPISAERSVRSSATSASSDCSSDSPSPVGGLGFGARRLSRTRPSSSTTPTASFVPPMSIAKTRCCCILSSLTEPGIFVP